MPAGLVCVSMLTFLCTQADPGLTVYESRYYIVETELSPKRAEYTARVMDATGKEYARRFEGFRGVVRQKPRVRVFADRERYLAAFVKACGEPNIHTRGIFCRLDGIVYTFEGDDLEPILRHECFHQFASLTIGGRLPKWTNEGLAEYFEEGIFDETSGRLELGAVPGWRLGLLRDARQDNALFPIDRLMHLGAREWNDNMGARRGRVQYSQVWLLCHFLVHGDGGQYTPLFDRFLHLLDQGLDGDTAFKRVFGADTGPLDGKLDEYLQKLEPSEPAPKRAPDSGPE